MYAKVPAFAVRRRRARRSAVALLLEKVNAVRSPLFDPSKSNIMFGPLCGFVNGYFSRR
ncbi:hypothetical protein ND808_26340 [Streptomyces sp. DR7-3]|uniref:hypothetical protein n=1 Tax=Streptomyces malaysiensis TaxID=92644 RepID=UPI0020442C83|nr:hypothetical protein [Streptomyces sp. DR7-3]MCM3809342.1 hypothetical protein [Streptomyces sp. DR7-3]